MPAEHSTSESIVAAYAGSAAGAAALEPALRVLRAALPEARLALLWPDDVPVPPLALAAADGRIGYAVSRASPDAAIATLAAELPALVVVFTEPGYSPEMPAYMGYLAGIQTRAGLATEFSGSVLSLRVEPPESPLPDEERHLYLLARVLDS